MARNLFVVNAFQTVISDSHPEGVFSAVSGYPKTFDSRNYTAEDENPNGNPELALLAAKSDFYTRLGALYAGSDTRVAWTVTLEQADGRQILREAYGAFPDMTPAEE